MKQKTLRYRALRRVRSLPAETASRLLAMPAISRKLNESYEKARASHRPRLPQLSPFDKDIVAGLERNGVYVTSLDRLDLPGTGALWRSATGIASAYSLRAGQGEFAGEYTVQVGAEEMMHHPHIVRWPLDDRILDIVETYLGLPAACDTLNFFHTLADGRQVAARRWHRDVEDRRMVKVIVYLHDVDEDGGPLEILHRAFPGSDQLDGGNFPVLTQEMLEQRLGGALEPGDVTSCTGKAGTVIFADVASRYHRGRPAIARDRSALFYNFFSRSPLRPFYRERHVFSRAQLAELAAGQSARARDCLLWHANVPLLARIVPRARS
ncbi:hypothetical protein KUL72_24685 [Bradyrhizobium arachidis]|uniref:hypothetical protein n=1 Tax=Bradyrhizobium TaxID=374 RepID=UPI002162192F|nr:MULTISPECIES: hypothetical protein [Bradyrhizobium]MDN4983161.1 hypothetical protein [Bradyrhizobium sp. WYCCWR 13022]UVO34649.1 hypothetical protein KUL72_24685 [Bradyrhizobium arachidis]